MLTIETACLIAYLLLLAADDYHVGPLRLALGPAMGPAVGVSGEEVTSEPEEAPSIFTRPTAPLYKPVREHIGEQNQKFH